MKVEVHEISQSNNIDIQILNFLVNLLSVEVDEWIKHLPAMQGIAGSIPGRRILRKTAISS